MAGFERVIWLVLDSMGIGPPGAGDSSCKDSPMKKQKILLNRMVILAVLTLCAVPLSAQKAEIAAGRVRSVKEL